MGCDELLQQQDEAHTCFVMTGSEQDGKLCMSFGTGCQFGCIVVGDSFCTHMAKNKGLMYHKVGIAPNFVCKACTVRAVLPCELRRTPQD
jgi:hypothetical protein